jgi:hypothetical protein
MALAVAPEKRLLICFLHDPRRKCVYCCEWHVQNVNFILNKTLVTTYHWRVLVCWVGWLVLHNIRVERLAESQQVHQSVHTSVGMASIEGTGRTNSPTDDVDGSDWVEEEEEEGQEDLDEEAVVDDEEGMEQISVVDETVNSMIVDAKVVSVRFAENNSGAEEEMEEVDPRRSTDSRTDAERRRMLADRKENEAAAAMSRRNESNDSRPRARDHGPDDECSPAHIEDYHHASSLDEDEYVQRLKSVAAADNDRAGVAVTGLTFATTMALRSFSKLMGGGGDGGDGVVVLDEDDIAAAVIMGTAQAGQGGAGGGVAASTGTAAATAATQP